MKLEKRISAFLALGVAVLACAALTGCASALGQKEGETLVRYGGDPGQVVEFCLPSGGVKHDGAVILIHGGGWHFGGRDDMKWQKKTYLEAGFIVYNMDYRLGKAPPYVTVGAKLDDIDSVVKLALTELQTRGMQPKIYLMGGSAGGHLSLLYAYGRGRGIITRVVSLFGPANLANPIYQQNELKQDIEYLVGKPWSAQTEGLYQAASPLHYVTGGECPTLLYHGDRDVLVPYSDAVDLDQALTKVGVEHTFITVPNGGHGNNWPNETWARFNQDSVDWFLR